MLNHKISQSLEVRVRDKKGRTLLKTGVRGDVEDRAVKRDVTVGKKRELQMKREKGEIVHLHCEPCNNSWGRNQGLTDLNEKFEVNENTVKCKKCKRVWRMGGGP